MEQQQFIVVEGPIGVGKTTLARRLSETLNGELLLEDADSNPFMTRFYENPRTSALPTQLFFLFQRAQQMGNLNQGDMFSTVRVADFLMAKDRLFAELTLDNHELDLYDQVAATLDIQVPVPDLVVYLQAPVDVLRQRISNRGISHEQQVRSHYLSDLVECYARFFHDYQLSPLLIVNAAEIDLVNKDEDYEMLLERIRTHRKGSQYFNPMPMIS